MIPRGGEGLIKLVAKKSRIPVIKHYKGICHVYVDSEADLNDEIRQVLIQKAAEGDMTAVIFYLKNRHPDFKQQYPNTAVQINFNQHAKEELEEFK